MRRVVLRRAYSFIKDVCGTGCTFRASQVSCLEDIGSGRSLFPSKSRNQEFLGLSQWGICHRYVSVPLQLGKTERIFDPKHIYKPALTSQQKQVPLEHCVAQVGSVQLLELFGFSAERFGKETLEQLLKTKHKSVKEPNSPYTTSMPEGTDNFNDSNHPKQVSEPATGGDFRMTNYYVFSGHNFRFFKASILRGDVHSVRRYALSGAAGAALFHARSHSSDAAQMASDQSTAPEVHDQSQRAVVTAIWCNFLVLALKCGVWTMTASHVMLAEAVHSFADLANQALLAYGLISSRRAPDALHPYGYSKERFVWSLISAVGIFCLGSGATIVHGMSNLWNAELPENIFIAALVIGGSMIMEGASLLVAISAVRKGASAEGMTLQDYVWRGHDPTAVAVMMEDGAAVTGLVVAGLSLVAVTLTGNPVYDPIGSIMVGNLLGMVAIFLIQRNRHALLGRAMDDQDMKRVLDFLSSDPVVDAIYDCKSEVIGPGSYRFKAEIDFNGVVIVQNYLRRTGREAWTKEFREAVDDPDECALDRVMAIYGEEVVTALGSEVDRLEKEIQRIVPGIRHVDIETHNPKGPLPRER